MAKKISVILLENIPDLGVAGDIVSVAEGYARNALFPNGRAALATPEARVQAQQKAAKERRTEEVRLAALQRQAEQLDGTELTLAAEVKEEGEEIFGKISEAAIAKELEKQAKIHLKPAQIKLEEPIVRLGQYKVTLSLASEVEAVLTVVVNRKADAKEKS
jgi:large subunit ribosomal protein L9